MDRINSVGAVVVGGIRQWVNKNLLAGIPGTQANAVYMNDLQEELVQGLIVKSGQTPTAGVQNQVKKAMDFFYAFGAESLSANYMVEASDRGTIFDCDSGCESVTLPNSGVLDDGFLVGFLGTFNVTTISLYAGNSFGGGGALNGETSVSIGNGDFILLQSRGTLWGVVATNLASAAVHGQRVITATSGNWTAPSGVWEIKVTLTGAGGQGAGSSATSLPGAVSGGGGGAGATAIFKAAVIPGTSYAYSVGGPSMSSAFLGLTAGQGGDAPAVSSSGAGAPGGVVSGLVAGQIGQLLAIPGGYGSDGQFNNEFIFAGDGGASFWGGGGRAGNGGGEIGQAPGSGGGGAYSSGTGGAGAGGVLVIEW